MITEEEARDIFIDYYTDITKSLDEIIEMLRKMEEINPELVRKYICLDK